MLTEASEALGNRSDFDACHDNSWRGASRSNFSFKLLLVFRCFTDRIAIFGVVFWYVKNKAINLDLRTETTILAWSLSRLCSMQALQFKDHRVKFVQCIRKGTI